MSVLRQQVPSLPSVVGMRFPSFVLTNPRRGLYASLTALTPFRVPVVTDEILDVFPGQKDVDLRLSIS